MNRKPFHRVVRGFTLVELLAMIAIIGNRRDGEIIDSSDVF